MSRYASPYATASRSDIATHLTHPASYTVLRAFPHRSWFLRSTAHLSRVAFRQFARSDPSGGWRQRGVSPPSLQPCITTLAYGSFSVCSIGFGNFGVSYLACDHPCAPYYRLVSRALHPDLPFDTLTPSSLLALPWWPIARPYQRVKLTKCSMISNF